jgi:hypothetical protein
MTLNSVERLNTQIRWRFRYLGLSLTRLECFSAMTSGLKKRREDMRKKICLVLLVLALIGAISAWRSENACATPDRGRNCAKCHTDRGSSKGFTSTFFLEKCNGFSTTGNNPYFILEEGYQLVLEGKEKKQTVHLTITVLRDTDPEPTKTVTLDIGGVRTDVVTRVIVENETKGGLQSEVSRNYFAICKSTNSVMYFGEEVDIYDDTGTTVVSHEGSWEAGVNGAQPGIMMPATILLGGKYFQEVAPAVAMDRAEIRSISEAVQVPAGNFTNCLKTRETTSLAPGVEFKFYAPNVGIVRDGSLNLIQYGVIP